MSKSAKEVTFFSSFWCFNLVFSITHLFIFCPPNRYNSSRIKNLCVILQFIFLLSFFSFKIIFVPSLLCFVSFCPCSIDIASHFNINCSWFLEKNSINYHCFLNYTSPTCYFDFSFLSNILSNIWGMWSIHVQKWSTYYTTDQKPYLCAWAEIVNY